jgi:hypothetical protein
LLWGAVNTAEVCWLFSTSMQYILTITEDTSFYDDFLQIER